jgi:transcriptional regulator with XRE-family HTH domain
MMVVSSIAIVVRCFMSSQEYSTLREYRIRLGWSINKLAIEAGVVRQAAANAEAGQPIRAETAKALADALSRGYGQKIDVLDIQGLNIL